MNIVLGILWVITSAITIIIFCKLSWEKMTVILLWMIFNCCISIKSYKEYIENNSNIEKTDSILIENTKTEINFEDSVYNLIISLNIKHPDIVLKQAKLESGNFKSNIFKENNNLFGMKIPYKRPNLVIGSNRGYAVYNNWKESIIDYALYQVYSAKDLTREEYIQMLGRSYAEDPNYTTKIK